MRILNRLTEETIFKSDKKTMKETVEEATRKGANLYLADLRDADLRDADLHLVDLHLVDLRGADLRGANLHDVGLIALTLSYYTVYVQRTHTQINDWCLENKQWRNLTNDKIAKLDEHALEFWTSYKDVIFSAMDSLQEDN